MASKLFGKKTKTQITGFRDPITRKGNFEFPTLFPFFPELTEEFRPLGLREVGTTGKKGAPGPLGLNPFVNLVSGGRPSPLEVLNPFERLFKGGPTRTRVLERVFPEDTRGPTRPRPVPAAVQPDFMNDIISLLSLGTGLQEAQPPPAVVTEPAKKETA